MAIFNSYVKLPEGINLHFIISFRDFPAMELFVEGIPMKHRSKLSRLSPLPWALASCGAPTKSIPRRLRPLNGEHHMGMGQNSVPQQLDG